MHNLDNFVLLLKTFSNPDIKKFLVKSGNDVKLGSDPQYSRQYYRRNPR